MPSIAGSVTITSGPTLIVYLSPWAPLVARVKPELVDVVVPLAAVPATEKVRVAAEAPITTSAHLNLKWSSHTHQALVDGHLQWRVLQCR